MSMGGTGERYHVAVSTDARYMPGAVVALAGVALNAREESNFVFHVFHDGVEEPRLRHLEETLARLHRNLEVVFHTLGEDMLAGLPYWATSRMAAARCLYPEILRDADKCLYLDCDVLYLASPEEHFSLAPSGGAMASVVREGTSATRSGEIGRIKGYCGIDVPDAECFNSGVMLLDLEAMRREKTTEKLLAFFRDHPDAASPDQDALNAVFAGRTVMLPGKWNVFQTSLDDAVLRSRPVVHFVSGVPWLPNPGAVMNGRFRLWHAFADKYVWGEKGASCRRLFTRKQLFLKAAVYRILKVPLLGAAFALFLQKTGRITCARQWRMSQVGTDVSAEAIREVLSDG